LKIERYQSASGRIPFKEWFDSLDNRERLAIDRRIHALEEHDHFGDRRSLQGGLFELRLMGVGLRIYFARKDRTIVLLLGGSDKKSQQRSIDLARRRLKEFIERPK